MRNDVHKLQGGVPRSSSSSGRNNGFFPSSLRAISSYLKIVSSGASSVASTVRSASASVVSSISDRDGDSNGYQVQWAGFDNLECEGGIVRQVLLLGYKSGFQVWDVDEADDVHELVSRYDGPVSFLQMQQKPLASKREADKFADLRPLLVVAGDGVVSGGSCIQDGFVSQCNGSTNGCHDLENRNFIPTVVRFYSLKSHSYVHILKFRTAVYSIRCSPRVVAISQAAQIHCLDAATLEKEYTILTHPIVWGSPGSGSIGYGPLAVGPRWLAYSGSPVPVSSSDRVSPQHLTRATTFSTSNGSLVALYAKESSKQIAAGIVTLGDMGYKKLSRYCSELLPDCNNSIRVGNPSMKSNGTMNGHLPDAENVGMVIVRDIVCKSVVAQFRAHRSPISALCFDPSGTLLVTASIQGHNINVFRIMSPPLGSSSGFDATGSYVHLYRLQRGVTNAVIQDISFSDDSQWIMISSSRGTSHLFALSPSGGVMNLHTTGPSSTNSGNGLGPTNKSVCSPPSSSLSMQNNQSHCAVGPPVTLSVVSRIKNGNNGWRGTVSGAAAAATGRVSALSGAIASAFRTCKRSDVYLDSTSVRTKNHLLVFSPSGSVIQYLLRLSSGEDSGMDLPGVGAASSYESSEYNDIRLSIEAVQKWDVCQWKTRREQEDNVDIYGEHGIGDSDKLFPKGTKKCNSVHPTNNGNVLDVKHSAEEKHHLYISEAELQMHPARIPLWARPEIYFQVILMNVTETSHENVLGGEIEIEKVQTRVVEARSRDLVPVTDHLQIQKFHESRVSPSIDFNRSGPQLCQKTRFLEDVRTLSCQSSRSSLDSTAESSTMDGENGWGGLQHSVLADSVEGFVNNRDSPKCKTRHEFVNNGKSPKMEEGQHEFVNTRESSKMDTQFEDDGNIFD